MHAFSSLLIRHRVHVAQAGPELAISQRLFLNFKKNYYIYLFCLYVSVHGCAKVYMEVRG